MMWVDTISTEEVAKRLEGLVIDEEVEEIE